ncbi:MAG: DEAD/DEAH box helicase, partial [Candidatus Tectomicrobia bacterium]|nr:DEAD/DEAH box helicase [Candidatus Tectomicrobia bacterium]
ASIAALLEERPDQSARYLQRFSKRYVPFTVEDHLLRAIALAQRGMWPQAVQVVTQHGMRQLYTATQHLPCGEQLLPWFRDWLRRIEHATQRRQHADRSGPRKAAPAVPKKARAATQPPALRETTPSPEAAGPPPLPRYSIQIPLTVHLPDTLGEQLVLPMPADVDTDGELFRLRYAWTQLGLLQGFDELLCLSALHDVEIYWYQVEAVRKVLKQFHGRVLLADEVGLGKTIEAGMVLKEYLLRGMVERVLILTPATLVGQWQEEMASKFEVVCATSYDALLRQDPGAFWAQPRVIASIATARRPEHRVLLAQQHYDLVIVDEAHHLKNRVTANWQLVNALQKRFLLLLSATPVQNSLVELYNLLTLLKPGIFKTEKEFRASYMTSGKPRVPANRERMRDLMRDVMIRNTRSLVDVHLSPRHATTLRLEPTAEEAACYATLSDLVQQAYQQGATQQRLALRHLLAAAGSHTMAAAAALQRYSTAHQASKAWQALQARYAAIQQTSKERTLCDLLRRNPSEHSMVFVQYRDTLAHLQRVLQQEAWPYVVFEGSMSGPEKDAAVERFRTDVPLLLCTESGGEGRNLQFCNTLINFDLPWNPMTIEQRIGRIHRIGQTREVFIFNLAVHGTLEDEVLRILDEKINMFELVVGEIDAILGAMSEEHDFADLVFTAWVETTETARASAFASLGERLADAKGQYEAIKALDETLFGEEFVAG